MARKNWSHDELLVAFDLYCKIPFGKIHNSNPEIVKLANIIGRSASAVSWKLANFARLDPSLHNRGIKGAQHGSKAEVKIWEEFNENWEELTYKSAVVLNKLENGPSLQLLDNDYIAYEGKDRVSSVKTRVNQNFFRSAILSAYNYACCITQIDIPELLIASHIIPWSVNKKNRINPMNGLCLNSLHDCAFDKGGAFLNL